MPEANEKNVRDAARQQQFLDVVSRDEATARFHAHLNLAPLDAESLSLAEALGRTLAADVASPVDVSGFDRSNVDGFAVQAADTFDAMEERPQRVALNNEVLSPGVEPSLSVRPGTATPIATGGMLPRGADAVVMIEDTELLETPDSNNGDDPATIEITRAVSPGQNVTFAGTDVAMGETVLRAGALLTSREIGVLAAIGMADVDVVRKPRVAVVSTGDEIVQPGGPRPPGAVYDSNLAIISAAVEELGGEAVRMGVVRDDLQELEEIVARAMKCDVVVLSGGTSKGAGDLSYRVVSRLTNPGVVAHGVALKPGKPICLAVSDGKPVVILPGFPTSAVFTFHEFVAPVIRALAGRPHEEREVVQAVLPMRVNSDRGRTEYLLVGLVRLDGERNAADRAAPALAAYPMGKGSGSVTTFSRADGFITIDQRTEIVDSGSIVDVQLLSRRLEPADLVFVGSHCVGLDVLLGEMHRRGFSTKALYVGSQGGLAAAQRGECDVAGVHLLDKETGEYNRPFVGDGQELLTGYRRMQAIVHRPGDARFDGKSIDDAVRAAMDDSECRMVNRNAGSGTRILIDELLEGAKPPGYAVQARSHNAAAAAIRQNRADWGVAIETVARAYGLSSIPLKEEHYDFVVPKTRAARPAVRAFREVLTDPDVRTRLEETGFGTDR